MNDRYLYFVEGECEKKLVNAIKNDFIISGKVHVKNLINENVTNFINIQIKYKTNVIIIFDTDVISSMSDYRIMNKNLETLGKNKNVKNIYLIPQIYNLEDELVFSMNIKTIKDLLNSKSQKEFKTDLLKSNLDFFKKRLLELNFSIVEFWSRDFKESYLKINNESHKIKIKQM